MKKFIFCLLVSLVTLTLDAQNNGSFSIHELSNNSGANSILSQVMMNKLRAIDHKNKDLSKDYIGSPYLTDNFTRTTLFYNGIKENTVFYRFNAYNQEIELKSSYDPLAIIYAINKDKKIAINVEGHPMSFKTFITSNNRTMNGYLITLFEGKEYDLYKRVNIKYDLGRPSPNSFVPPVPARFSKFIEYYFQKKDVNRIDEILLNNRKLLNLLDGTTKTKVKTYIKETKLNIKNEAELITVFKFLNTK